MVSGGCQIQRAGGVVQVRDGEDTWLTTREAWAAAQVQLEAQEEIADDAHGTPGHVQAYGALCDAMPSPVLTLIGDEKGTDAQRAELAARAAAVDLLPDGLWEVA
jgi:hypothetical protein